MNEIKITGKQKFLGLEIPVVLGGFGGDKKCISDKTIAEIHGMREPDVRRRITDNIKRFKEGVDFIDMKKRIVSTDTLCNERVYLAHTLENGSCALEARQFLETLGYTKQSITQAEHIYILSERGYAKLIKIMDTDLAWEIHDKLIDEYFELREEKMNMNNLSPELRLLINMELEQKRQAQELSEVRTLAQSSVDRVEGIREVVALNTVNWRKDTAAIINKIAMSLGGYEHIKAIREESYRLLEQRMGVALNIRLTNKKKTMSLNGVCKSKIEKLNQLDVIADDKKLIEGYVAIVKEMAIKYGIV